MADDLPQRPYRSALPPTRGPAASTAPAGSDPLAELARLIGQNDPFAEFGRDGGRHADSSAAAPRQSEAVLNWPSQTRHRDAAGQATDAQPLADAQQFGTGSFGQSPFGGDQYQPETEASSYGVPGYSAPPAGGEFGHPPVPPGGDYGYAPYQDGQDQNAYPGQDPNQLAGFGQYGAEDDDYYDDVPANRRRIGIIAIAGVFALAVIGTAGAFGYRAIFGSSASSGPPPVIKADTTPSKIVPATAGKDAQNNKLITDRVNERGQGEKLVSREEQPVPITTTKPSDFMAPQSQSQANVGQLGSGVVGGDAKRIRTIVIHPDQASGGSEASPAPEAAPVQQPSAAPQPQPRVVHTPPARPAAPPRTINEAAAAPTPRPTAPRAAAPAPSNAPLSLNPNASAPVRAASAPRNVARAPTRLAAATTTAGGGYAVQVTARRSEADAEAAFRSLQAKYPSQLGGHQPLIKRVDLGAKGIYFRAMIGPYGSSGEASSVCSSLKAAGGACIVQRN